MENRLKIVIDSAIPYIKGAFEPYASVNYIESREIDADAVKDADALIIRTRTRCDENLLSNSKVRHIATATIGFDHIDLDYCHLNNIGVTTAAGCNARGVLQWVGVVLAHLSKVQGWKPSDRTLGVVGVGHVGSLIERYAKLWGFNVICCDPPRQEAEDCDFISLEELCSQADIITLHTPLNNETRQMINSTSLAITKPNAVIINSSRGEVINTEALLESQREFILDVWEGEPHLNAQALERALIATTHIAGYSAQGKANATTMAVRQIASALDLPLTSWSSDHQIVEPLDISWKDMKEEIGEHCDIVAESLYLKSHPDKFEDIRNNYNYREEFF